MLLGNRFRTDKRKHLIMSHEMMALKKGFNKFKEDKPRATR